MKTLITLLLLASISTQAQDSSVRFYPIVDLSQYQLYPDSSTPFVSIAFIQDKPQSKWYKITKGDYKLMAGSAATGTFYALNQSLLHHHLGRGNQFWDVNVSWKNKYKDFDKGDMRAKYPMSKNVLAFTTDGFHLSQFAYRVAGTVTLAFALSDFDAYHKKDRWKVIGKKLVLCTLTERLFFNAVFGLLGSH